MLAAGDTFASYEVLRRLAAGGMGEVFLCRHRILDRLDAVKVLRPHLAGQDDFRRRFLREALSAARLRHPNVVTVYTADESTGRLYLAMEYVPGEDLAAVLRRVGRLEPGRLVRLLTGVADALDAAHRINLVHRDIKPSNLLVTSRPADSLGLTLQETAVLVDFGISRPIDADSEITRTGEIVGTIAYCAPEQLSGHGVDGACDQYALACVAYEGLTGQVPYPFDGQLAIAAAHLTEPAPRPAALRPELPPAVDEVIARGMAKGPRDRFASCTDFVAALRAALVVADHPEFAAPYSLLERLAERPAALIRPAGHPAVLALRAGWAGAEPWVLPLVTGPVAVRAPASTSAASLRWLLAQAVARHTARDLCLAVAAAAVDGENWLWVNWLPHARPSNPPLSGAHVATTAEAAADLVDRLRSVIRVRAAGASPIPRVLAVLDQRLGVGDRVGADPDLADAGRYGVHLLVLVPDQRPTPVDMSTLDLSGERPAGRLFRIGQPPVDGVPDLVPASYPRELADFLPDD